MMGGIDSQFEGSEDELEMEAIVLSNPPPPVSVESAPQELATDTSSKGDKGKGTLVAIKMPPVMNSQSILGPVKKNFVSVKRLVEDQVLRQCCCTSGDLGGTRMYHLWPGNNVFFFHGRLVCGPDPRGLMLTTISIVLSSWIFATYNAGKSSSLDSTLMVVFSTILTAIVLVNLFVVSSIDPGIIPRNDQPPSEEIGTSNGTRKKRVTINGVELKLRYCRVCKIFRPPRSCHCTICNNCVEKFDHHCPWIGQCIALRNYWVYLMLLVSAFIFFAYILAFSCCRIHWRMRKAGIGLFKVLKNYPETIALTLFSSAATLFLGGLCIFHVYLTATNQTSYEKYRQRYLSSPNPFDKGVLSNIKEVLLAPFPRSKLDFRARITPENDQNRKAEMID